MHVEFYIEGRYHVAEGTQQVTGSQNLFRLPSGQIVSVHPIIEMASDEHSDDHHNLGFSEAEALGIVLDLYDRQSDLEPGD